MVVAPHPDDETIAAFGVLHAAVRQARRVTVVIVTDGAASHDSAAWPPKRLAALRERETLCAMRRAGVRKNEVRFLRYGDSALCDLDRAGRRALRRDLQRMPQPDLVVRPSRADHHIDHRIVGEACEAAWPGRVRQLTYLVWPEQGARFQARYAVPLGPLRELKRAAIMAYRSQTGLIDDDPNGFCIDQKTIARFCGPVERFGEA
jgi:LmbE family N-acetylglucosaminyl deacetylase